MRRLAWSGAPLAPCCAQGYTTSGSWRGLEVTVITSNWLVRNSFLIKTGTEFNEGYGFSGGSDTEFFKRAKARRAKSGWAPTAIVSEMMPLSRLTLGYQFNRASQQSIASFRLKYPQATVLVRSVMFFVLKMFAAALLLIAALWTKGQTLTAAARSAGFAVGRLRALQGAVSTHYKETHGF